MWVTGYYAIEFVVFSRASKPFGSNMVDVDGGRSFHTLISFHMLLVVSKSDGEENSIRFKLSMWIACGNWTGRITKQQSDSYIHLKNYLSMCSVMKRIFIYYTWWSHQSVQEILMTWLVWSVGTIFLVQGYFSFNETGVLVKGYLDALI